MFPCHKLQSSLEECQDLKQGPNLAEYQGATSRCSVPETTEQLGEAQDGVSNRIQQQTAEQIVDMPVFKGFSQERISERISEQSGLGVVIKILSKD